MKKITSNISEIAVANLFDYRVYTIVPNVSYGLGLNHECDMLLLSSSGYFTEVEIKVSKADLLADFKKSHGHRSKIISRLYYAIPTYLMDCLPLIPKEHGVIEVYEEELKRWDYNNKEYVVTGIIHRARFVRRVIKNKHSEKPSVKVVQKFMSLGCMRIWSLKTVIKNSQKVNAKI